MLCERSGPRSADGTPAAWRVLRWGEALAAARAIAQALIDRGLGPSRPLMVLSGNSIEHAQLMLGALLAGVPIAPLSPAYALLSTDFGKLRRVTGMLRPGMVFAQDGAAYARALRALSTKKNETPKIVQVRTILTNK